MINVKISKLSKNKNEWNEAYGKKKLLVGVCHKMPTPNEGFNFFLRPLDKNKGLFTSTVKQVIHVTDSLCIFQTLNSVYQVEIIGPKNKKS